MEVAKYLCEFFFGNFWHWLGLWILIHTSFSITLKERRSKKDEEKEE